MQEIALNTPAVPPPGPTAPPPALYQDMHFDAEIAPAPGDSFAIAAFRLVLPCADAPVKAVLVLVPGSNGDGRNDGTNHEWQDFARHNSVAILSCYFKDPPHPDAFAEEYVRAGRGSGQALLSALDQLAPRCGHPELARAPLLLWGMSAGGQFNYEFVAWRPERVACFVVNKGGIYYSALLPEASRQVPGLFFTGQDDMRYRSDTIAGLFAVNRRVGARWALVDEPGIAHAEGQSPRLARLFFSEIMRQRASGSIAEGVIADPATGAITPLRETRGTDHPTSWYPSLQLAREGELIRTRHPSPPTLRKPE